jgi:hypothetical protein
MRQITGFENVEGWDFAEKAEQFEIEAATAIAESLANIEAEQLVDEIKAKMLELHRLLSEAQKAN